MKKIVTLLLTVIMIAANASAVFAADCNYSLGTFTGSADINALKPGDVINFAIALDSNPGLAYVKNTMTFDSDVFERVDYEAKDFFGNTTKYPIYSPWGSFTVNDAQTGKTIFNWSSSTNNTNTTMGIICYKVKDNVNNGDYDFDLVCNEAKNASTKAVNIGATKCIVKVTGGKEPAGEDKVTVTPDERSEKKDNESGLWTYGFSGTVTTTGSASYSRLIFNFKDGDKEGKEPYIWEVGTSLNTPITYGLNVWGCPVGSDVTATVTAE